jgi:hypothetical protein
MLGGNVDHIPPHFVVGALLLHNTFEIVRGYSHVVSYTAKTDDVGGNTCATKPAQHGETAPTPTSLSYPLTMKGNACQLSVRADSMHSRPYLAKAPSMHIVVYVPALHFRLRTIALQLPDDSHQES